MAPPSPLALPLGKGCSKGQPWLKRPFLGALQHPTPSGLPGPAPTELQDTGPTHGFGHLLPLTEARKECGSPDTQVPMLLRKGRPGQGALARPQLGTERGAE